MQNKTTYNIDSMWSESSIDSTLTEASYIKLFFILYKDLQIECDIILFY